ncbi:hypothetical protein [Flavobacterium sp.]|uniref:hypothetical protein n=1 Tax=Flavobacterium sp. TaxID=239 RepID=UPI0025BA728A|nr:hypothetical protein [Flavobacterium sp.]MBA4155365.1 hypothetical protein [Flavobacterium sp.]
MTETAFCSVIFPANLIYFKDFLDSLEQQTDSDFILLLFNDGVENLTDYLKESSLNYKIINVKGSISETRTQLFEYLKKSTFEKIIFGDTDDYFSLNRVEDCREFLNKFDIIANDLILVSEKKEVLSECYWKDRQELRGLINLESIKFFNFLGLGNTAINRKILPESIFFDPNIVAIDWFLYSIILKSKIKVGFTSSSFIYYRQHGANIVGRKELNFEDFKKGFTVKLNHYSNLARVIPEFQYLATQYLDFMDSLTESNYKKIIQKNKIQNPFWWEEIQL